MKDAIERVIRPYFVVDVVPEHQVSCAADCSINHGCDSLENCGELRVALMMEDSDSRRPN